jgi:phosphopantothenoylcysteine decarboxylase/phosphopantothenate--cysteine ligase
MHDAVLREFPSHDLLIMAAAVADYRPIHVHSDKLGREGALTIECEATPDIVATAAKIKRPGQRIIGFSLESEGNLARARQKLARKNLDLIVYNPVGTMNSEEVEATLIWPDGREEPLPRQSKSLFASHLMARVAHPPLPPGEPG